MWLLRISNMLSCHHFDLKIRLQSINFLVRASFALKYGSEKKKLKKKTLPVGYLPVLLIRCSSNYQYIIKIKFKTFVFILLFLCIFICLICIYYVCLIYLYLFMYK